jgi:hypothetical protein
MARSASVSFCMIPTGSRKKSPRVAGTSDNRRYVAPGLALLHAIRTWCGVREGRCRKKPFVSSRQPAVASGETVATPSRGLPINQRFSVIWIHQTHAVSHAPLEMFPIMPGYRKWSNPLHFCGDSQKYPIWHFLAATLVLPLFTRPQDRIRVSGWPV